MTTIQLTKQEPEPVEATFTISGLTSKDLSTLRAALSVAKRERLGTWSPSSIERVDALYAAASYDKERAL